MQDILTCAMGLDIHRDVIVACLAKGELGTDPEIEIRSFSTLIPEMRKLRDWVLEAECRYGLWYEMREEVLRTYKDELPERLPLSHQKEFKAIRNLVIREAVRLGELQQVFCTENQTGSEGSDTPEQEPDTSQKEKSEKTGAPPPTWERRFRRAWAVLQDSASPPEQTAQALEEVTAAAEAGYRPAQYRLGKVLL